MAEWERGERKLYWPTWYTVTQLAACETAEALLDLTFDTREPDDAQVERLPRSVFWQDLADAARHEGAGSQPQRVHAGGDEHVDRRLRPRRGDRPRSR